MNFKYSNARYQFSFRGKKCLRISTIVLNDPTYFADILFFTKNTVEIWKGKKKKSNLLLLSIILSYQVGLIDPQRFIIIGQVQFNVILVDGMKE